MYVLSRYKIEILLMTMILLKTQMASLKYSHKHVVNLYSFKNIKFTIYRKQHPREYSIGTFTTGLNTYFLHIFALSRYCNILPRQYLRTWHWPTHRFWRLFHSHLLRWQSNLAPGPYCIQKQKEIKILLVFTINIVTSVTHFFCMILPKYLNSAWWKE